MRKEGRVGHAKVELQLFSAIRVYMKARSRHEGKSSLLNSGALLADYANGEFWALGPGVLGFFREGWSMVR